MGSRYRDAEKFVEDPEKFFNTIELSLKKADQQQRDAWYAWETERDLKALKRYGKLTVEIEKLEGSLAAVKTAHEQNQNRKQAATFWKCITCILMSEAKGGEKNDEG